MLGRTIAATMIAVLTVTIAPQSIIAATAPCPAMLDHKFANLMDEPLSLCQYAGKVVLIVNTATSRTPER